MESMECIRSAINNIDQQLEELLIQRLGMVKEVAKIKKVTHKPINDPKREQMILKRMKERTPAEYDIYIEKMFKSLFDISKEYQEVLING